MRQTMAVAACVLAMLGSTAAQAFEKIGKSPTAPSPETPALRPPSAVVAPSAKGTPAAVHVPVPVRPAASEVLDTTAPVAAKRKPARPAPSVAEEPRPVADAMPTTDPHTASKGRTLRIELSPSKLRSLFSRKKPANANATNSETEEK